MIAYILKVYPKLSEAFILDELCELKRQEVPFLVWALGTWREEKEHPETKGLDDRVKYLDRDGLPRLTKAAALTRLWFGNRSRWKRAHAILRKENRRQFAFTYSQSLSRAITLRRLGVTHIHAHFASIAADHALALSLLSGIPFSLTLHGDDFLVNDHPSLQLICEHADAILTPSRYNADRIAERFSVPPSRIRVIANGVQPERFQPSVRESGDGRTVLTVARLEPVKGIPVLIDAYARLKERGVPFRAVLVGEGSQRTAVEDQIRRSGLDGQIELRGDLPREEVEKELKRADIFALSSRAEGFPVSILEAMSCGIPVVAPEITGIPEQITHGEHGLLVKPEDPASLAQAMERLLLDSALRERMGRAARERVLKKFSLARVVGERIEYFMRDKG